MNFSTFFPNWSSSFDLLSLGTYLGDDYWGWGIVKGVGHRAFLARFPYRRKQRGYVPSEDLRCCLDAYVNMEKTGFRTIVSDGEMSQQRIGDAAWTLVTIWKPSL